MVPPRPWRSSTHSLCTGRVRQAQAVLVRQLQSEVLGQQRVLDRADHRPEGPAARTANTSGATGCRLTEPRPTGATAGTSERGSVDHRAAADHLRDRAALQIVEQHDVGAPPGRDLAAIGQAERPRRTAAGRAVRGERRTPRAIALRIA